MAQATDEAVNGFLIKLAEFHATLDDTEKAMLDELTVAALNTPEEEVAGFAFSTTPTTPTIGASLMAQAPDTMGKYYYYYGRIAGGMPGQGLRR